MNTGFRHPASSFEHPSLDTKCLITANLLLLPSSTEPRDFSGGQITSDAGLLSLRAFDQRHHLSSGWAASLIDPRQDENAPSAREVVRLNDRLRKQFIALCGQQVRQRGEIRHNIGSSVGDSDRCSWPSWSANHLLLMSVDERL